jgi:hypothetical protein
MDRKIALAAGLLLISGLTYRTTESRSSKGPVTPPASISARTGAAAANVSRESGPWTPVCRHFRLEESSDQGDLNETPLSRFCLDQANAHRLVLIATVPDPELTHLALVFDRYVESISWAVADGNGSVRDPEQGLQQDRRYSFESYWFPRRSEDTQESPQAEHSGSEPRREKRIS